jgi:phosphotransferase system  glucose/maltose/N-acetylglucosamine-specific IIC component
MKNVELNVLNMIANFLTSKLNVYLLYTLSYGLIYYILTSSNSLNSSISMTVSIIGITIFIHIISRITGVSRGMLIATIHKEELDEIIKQMDEEEIDEM